MLSLFALRRTRCVQATSFRPLWNNNLMNGSRGLQVSKKCFPPDISFTPNCRRQQLEGIIDEHVTIIGPVHVGPNTHVRSGAILKGPLIVGPNSVIEYGVRVLGGSFIGASTHLNSGAVISNSLLMNNCLVGENCVIQNSVLGFGVAAGAGSSSEMWRPLLTQSAPTWAMVRSWV